MRLHRSKGEIFTLVFVIVLVAFSSLIAEKSSTPEAVKSEIYQLVRVIDGDTIEISRDGKVDSVRLLGIDAPEKDQCFYEESKRTLANLVGNNSLSLSADPLNEEQDEYGRLLRYVYKNDILVNEVLIKDGSAKYLPFFPITLSNQFAELEKQAKENNLGLWNKCY